MNNSDWYVYVLRYNYSGNYYVGATPSLEKRMKKHLSTSRNKRIVPGWSQDNKSFRGFDYYWFEVEGASITQSISNKKENDLSFVLRDYLKKIDSDKHVIGGCLTQGNYPKIKVTDGDSKETLIDGFLRDDKKRSELIDGLIFLENGKKTR
ncbi:GIY-YIG nuclease family protein [Vagococcus carniphilus]|uniref:GIY-YIG nuclease family protein n=1 Tax=Vagococcus carniphilus TaxID=218144 RepID=UPI00288DFE45|nr:GIY-YIG nuclease family protein [Vagococcus carniphilus]MDT2830916.1 GIY-YIG nuclease family protein [Vagococcus carniphilus]MDT2838187.1 GIY-YIG nuclease family protein [Vagococcus carniphilus]MDT2853652.1 GIY-YIG nuclease family protein [Vagococcus carniphilus]